MFSVKWNAAAVALDYDHSFYNFSHVSSMDKQHAVKVLRQYVL